jgi:hypothetical protein
MVNFDSEKHEYTVDEKIVPYITGLLPEQNYFISEEELEICRDEGSENHSLIKMYFDTGGTYDDPMLIALEKWLNENSALLGKLLLYEQPLYSEKYKFAGTPDAIFENAIIEFKRSFDNKYYHSLQVAAQQILAKENKIINKTRKWLVLWYNGKEFKSRNVYQDKAEDIFISLVKKHYIDKAVEKFLKGEM